MALLQYLECARRLCWGKRVNSALYVYCPTDWSLGPELDALLGHLRKSFGVPVDCNVVKFRLDERKVSFLSYPEFFEHAHPALKHVTAIDLVTGRVRITDYSGNPNPPILHRKETFLPKGHPSRNLFSQLTLAEEEAGLFENTAAIGFKLNWERLLAKKGIAIDGHQLLTISAPGSTSLCKKAIEITRHKTAMRRYDLSKPMKCVLEHGLLHTGATVFDYGCGLGSDVAALRSLGYEAQGWDPVHRSDTPKQPSDVVNLGYVLNVIEDPAERIETLLEAYRLSKRLLIVSALINRTGDLKSGVRYQDGIVTQRNTFQKFYDQAELHQFIEDVLDTTAIPVALGVFYVFCDLADQQDFLSRRTRRTMDWGTLSSRLGLGRPAAPSSRTRVRLDLYVQHKELFDAFWRTLLELGRLPRPSEFERDAELREAIGSPSKAERLFVQKFGAAAFRAARDTRRSDLLVYLALAHLRRLTPFGQLSERLRHDIREFFGDYKSGLQEGRDLLFAAGDPGEIELACEEVTVGHQDQQALYVHRSLLNSLPALLRVYVGCAEARYGDLTDVDVIKIHKVSGKVTFLIYDDFEAKPMPELQQRIKVDLKRFFVQVFDYSEHPDAQLLYFKERYVGSNHPGIKKIRDFSERLKKLGISDEGGFGPNKAKFLAMLAARGLTPSLHKRRTRQSKGS
jgi:DNA phosphorothioation-associated putative methyltransferase